MNVEQCKALGLVPYAVYGGKVESFKVRETAMQAYGDPALLKVIDDLLNKVERLTDGLKVIAETGGRRNAQALLDDCHD